MNQLLRQKAFQRLKGLIYFTDGYGTFPAKRPLYETAFDGIMTGNASALLRFYEQGDTLYQSMLAKDFGVNERIYDYSTMKIVRPSNNTYVNIVIESYTLNDPTRVKVNLSFSYERGNWYLDSPTY